MEIFDRVRHAVLDVKVDVHEVIVIRDHQRLLVHRLVAPRAVDDGKPKEILTTWEECWVPSPKFSRLWPVMRTSFLPLVSLVTS